MDRFAAKVLDRPAPDQDRQAPDQRSDPGAGGCAAADRVVKVEQLRKPCRDEIQTRD
jgi:hypothetical protein